MDSLTYDPPPFPSAIAWPVHNTTIVVMQQLSTRKIFIFFSSWLPPMV